MQKKKRKAIQEGIARFRAAKERNKAGTKATTAGQDESTGTAHVDNVNTNGTAADTTSEAVDEGCIKPEPGMVKEEITAAESSLDMPTTPPGVDSPGMSANSSGRTRRARGDMEPARREAARAIGRRSDQKRKHLKQRDEQRQKAIDNWYSLGRGQPPAAAKRVTWHQENVDFARILDVQTRLYKRAKHRHDGSNLRKAAKKWGEWSEDPKSDNKLARSIESYMKAARRRNDAKSQGVLIRTLCSLATTAPILTKTLASTRPATRLSLRSVATTAMKMTMTTTRAAEMLSPTW